VVGSFPEAFLEASRMLSGSFPKAARRLPGSFPEASPAASQKLPGHSGKSLGKPVTMQMQTPKKKQNMCTQRINYCDSNIVNEMVKIDLSVTSTRDQIRNEVPISLLNQSMRFWSWASGPGNLIIRHFCRAFPSLSAHHVLVSS
jgi:hypothetical protein